MRNRRRRTQVAPIIEIPLANVNMNPALARIEENMQNRNQPEALDIGRQAEIAIPLRYAEVVGRPSWYSRFLPSTTTRSKRKSRRLSNLLRNRQAVVAALGKTKKKRRRRSTKKRKKRRRRSTKKRKKKRKKRRRSSRSSD